MEAARSPALLCVVRPAARQAPGTPDETTTGSPYGTALTHVVPRTPCSMCAAWGGQSCGLAHRVTDDRPSGTVRVSGQRRLRQTGRPQCRRPVSRGTGALWRPPRPKPGPPSGWRPSWHCIVRCASGGCGSRAASVPFHGCVSATYKTKEERKKKERRKKGKKRRGRRNAPPRSHRRPCSPARLSCWQRRAGSHRRVSAASVSNSAAARASDEAGGGPPPTSSWSSPCSAARQSSMRSRSVASTTQTSASVRSK